MIPFSQKLALLRALMKDEKIDVFIVPSSDPHIGEQIPWHWKIIPWLTGFNGSAGTVVITDTFAGLWTDSRYFIQAERQLKDSGFEFVRPEKHKRYDYIDFLCENISPGTTVGLDGRIFPAERFRMLESRLREKEIIIKSECRLTDLLWKNRPAMPFSEAFDHPLEFCGKERASKISEVRQQMKLKNAEYQLLTAPDDIMWLLNIRGGDLEYSPLLLSFALVGMEQLLFFVDEDKFSRKLAAEFDTLGVVILPYEDAEIIISSVTEGSSVLVHPQTTSVSMLNAVSGAASIVEDISIPSRLKAIKNSTEIENICKVVLKDGVALVRLYIWLENNTGRIPLSESAIAAKVNWLRMQQEDFLGPSFETIVAFGANSALPHYIPDDTRDDPVGERGLLLIDSGGHYMGGTTDITRTVSIGIPEAIQKRDFTLVLKGHINLAMARFPSGTRGYQLDLLARRAMWGSGVNYTHGTGHGVGYCLNVHEGPQSISPADNRTTIEAGMLTSNEPAIYREGEYGIRTENLILCYEDEETEYGKFMRFDTVTLCFIDKNLIDPSALNDQEIEWLNRYHSEVYDRLSPFLADEEREWLREKTGELN